MKGILNAFHFFILPAIILPSLAASVADPEWGEGAARPAFVDPRRRTTTGRICYQGNIILATIPTDTPGLVELDASKVYPKDLKENDKGPVSGQIVGLKFNVMHPLLNKVASELVKVAATKAAPALGAIEDMVQYPWWVSMYEAGLCIMQERLTADNEFLYSFRPTRKITAEPIYFLVAPLVVKYPTGLDAQLDIPKLRKEYDSNVAALRALQQGRNYDQFTPWMTSGVEERTRQLARALSKAYAVVAKDLIV